MYIRIQRALAVGVSEKLLNEKDKYVDIIVDAIEQEYNNVTQDKVKVNMGDGTYIYSSYASKDTTMRLK